MTEEKTTIRSLFLYVMTAVIAVALSSWLASQLAKRAFSQTQAQEPSSVLPPPAPPPPPVPVVSDQPPSSSSSSAAQTPQSATPQPTAAEVETKSQIEIFNPQGVDVAAKSSQIEQKIPDQLAGIIEDYSYNPMGKRDPFLPFEHPSNSSPQGPIWPLQKFELDQLKLVGVIWDVKTPKAMILDPSGHGYVVTVNERVGRNNGYIARIREGEIVVIENVTSTEGKISYITKLMKLQPQ